MSFEFVEINLLLKYTKASIFGLDARILLQYFSFLLGKKNFRISKMAKIFEKIKISK